MPVATEVVPPPPAQPELSSFDKLYYALQDFIKNYWGFLLFLIVGFGFVYMVYTIRKERAEKKKTSYERLNDKMLQLASQQSDGRRIQTNSLLMWGFSGIIGFVTFTLMVIIFGFIGLFMGGLFAFTILVIGGLIQNTINPFAKRDAVYMRYRDGVLKEKFIGEYGGEYYSSDGYLNLLIFGRRKKIIFREKFIIRVPQSVRSFYDVEGLQSRLGKDPEEDKKIKATLKTIEDKYSDFIKDLVQFNENTVVINNCKALDKFKFAYYPVFVDSNNQIINRAIKYYKSLKDQAVMEVLYDQTDEYSRAQLKAIQINPRVQYKQATNDEVIEDVDDEDKDK